MQLTLLILTALTVDAARLVKQAPKGISPDCNGELNRLRDPKIQKESADCEQKGQYPDRVLNYLKQGDEANATKLVEEMFKKCAGFSEKCAAEVAPGLVMEVRFSGVAVSEKCFAEVEKVQKDQEAQQVAAKCQQEEKTGENILMALNKNDLKTAMDVADNSLQKCMKMSKKCSWQLSPVLVNDVVMQAMAAQQAQQAGGAQQTPMTVVLTAPKGTKAVSSTILKLALDSRKEKPASLLAMAVPKVVLPTDKNLRSKPVLLQQSSKHWVSKLLLMLARQQL
jgi:ATP-dependent Clp protease adapter protein ClpS